MYRFIEIDLNQIDDTKFNSFQTKTIYTTVEWLRFIERTHNNVKIKVLEIYENKQFIGYFTGGLVTIAGLFRILGSPFNGWNTPFMGFDLYDVNKAIDILPHVVKYFQEKHGCFYSQICNMYFISDKLKQNAIKFQNDYGFQTDLTLTEEEIYSKFTRGTKSKIKRFDRLGCYIAEDYSQEFIDIFWEQLVLVFGKQGLYPSYDKNRVEVMIEELKKKNMILCIKAVTPGGICAATLVQIGYGHLTITVGCPSSLKHRNEYRPNEALIWYAIKYWKRRGAKVFDYGGGGEYKKKYGCHRVEYCIPYYTRIPGLILLKNLFYKAFWIINHLRAAINGVRCKTYMRARCGNEQS